MKTYLIIILALFLLGVAGTANAAVITDSLYGTLSVFSPQENYSGFAVGDTMHLFDVTYDNAGTERHIFNDDNTVQGCIDISDFTEYTFFSDAVFVFSSNLLDLISSVGGGDYYSNHNFRYVYMTEAGQNIYHRSYEDTWLLAEVSPIFSAAEIKIAGTNQTGTGLLFDDIRVVSTAPSPTPEPSTFLIFGFGCIGLAGYHRRSST